MSSKESSSSRTSLSSEPGAPQYPIESVDNALKLLLLFEERPQVRLTEASQYLEVASSTAHRLLSMLQWRGFVRQNPTTRAYEPGPALSSIASAIMRHFDPRERARPIMQRLHQEFDETVHLVRLEGADVHFVDAIESTRALRTASRTGRMLPAHATSGGKAMLSLLDSAELHRLYPDEKLPAVTGRTITSRAQLEIELETTRKRGFSVNRQESEEGVESVSVPVATESGAHYAINIATPSQRMTPAVRKEIAAQLVVAAAELRTLLP